MVNQKPQETSIQRRPGSRRGHSRARDGQIRGRGTLGGGRGLSHCRSGRRAGSRQRGHAAQDGTGSRVARRRVAGADVRRSERKVHESESRREHQGGWVGRVGEWVGALFLCLTHSQTHITRTASHSRSPRAAARRRGLGRGSAIAGRLGLCDSRRRPAARWLRRQREGGSGATRGALQGCVDGGVGWLDG